MSISFQLMLLTPLGRADSINDLTLFHSEGQADSVHRLKHLSVAHDLQEWT